MDETVNRGRRSIEMVGGDSYQNTVVTTFRLNMRQPSPVYTWPRMWPPLGVGSPLVGQPSRGGMVRRGAVQCSPREEKAASSLARFQTHGREQGAELWRLAPLLWARLSGRAGDQSTRASVRSVQNAGPPFDRGWGSAVILRTL